MDELCAEWNERKERQSQRGSWQDRIEEENLLTPWPEVTSEKGTKMVKLNYPT